MLIETTNLVKKYGKKLALNKVNLQINRGQLVAYLETNGAGKSTTINILTGLLAPSAGVVTVANGLKIGVVFQNSVLDNQLTVQDNLQLQAKMYRHFSTAWLTELISLIGIKDFLHPKYGTLSEGAKTAGRHCPCTNQPARPFVFSRTNHWSRPADPAGYLAAFTKTPKGTGADNLFNYPLRGRSCQCRPDVYPGKWPNPGQRVRR